MGGKLPTMAVRSPTNLIQMPIRQQSAQQLIDEVYRRESRRVLATLIRLLGGNFELAEEALHDAFTAALAQWPQDGIPENPRAWLVSTGRFKAIDRLRKNARLEDLSPQLAGELEEETADMFDAQTIEDDQLRLIFTCCHPSLAEEARAALTLREVCGLTTEAIAAAFLVSPTTLAQRIVRAKGKIRDAHIPYEVPERDDLPERLESVLQVIYLVFNEGYSASTGDSVTRRELCAEAIRLCRLLKSLLPEAEVIGLLALMLLQDSRRDARTSVTGDLVLLEHQDRNLWNREQINEGCKLVLQALGTRRFGSYSLQAAIAAVHAEAPNAAATDWAEITGLYDALLQLNPSPVVALNRAVALAMRDGPAAGLAAIEVIFAEGRLLDYHLAHAACADLYRRLGNRESARAAYQKALALAQQEPEQRFLRQRLAELQ